MATAKVVLKQSLKPDRQFVATTGDEHSLLLDDGASGRRPKPIELVAAALDCRALEETIRLSDEKYRSASAMVTRSTLLHTSYEIVKENGSWLAAKPEPANT